MKRRTMLGLALLILLAGLGVLTATGWAQDAGTIVTVAGSGDPDQGALGGDNGPATAARLNVPGAIFVDDQGNLYIADTYNHRIRKVDAATGIITTVAGSGSPLDPLGDGGPATAAGLYNPVAIFADDQGNLYITDSLNHRIRKVDAATGIITTVAGSGNFYDPLGDGGPATQANMNNPRGVCLDSAGNLYIASTHRIRRVDVFTGIITTVAGNGTPAFAGDGGLATAASLSSPIGVYVDDQGNLYIADTNNRRIRKVDAVTGIITTVAGDGTEAFAGDGGPATAASLSSPITVYVDENGDLYIADGGNHRIRKVDATTGIITTVAGDGFTYGTGWSNWGRFTGDGGPAREASLNWPYGISVDKTGNLYIADMNNHRIRKVIADRLKLQHVFAQAGGQAIVEVVLDTYNSVVALQFKVQPRQYGFPSSNAQFNSLVNNLEDQGFRVRAATDADGVTTIVVWNDGALERIPSGQKLILKLTYDIDPGVSPTRVIDLAVWADVLSDPYGEPILHGVRKGYILVTAPGDVNGDGQVDILDVVKTIRFILELSLPNAYEFFAADMDGSGVIDVADVVVMVNKILGLTKPVADGPKTPVTVSLGAAQTLDAGRLAVPVTMAADGTIAGVQAVFTFPANQLQVGTPYLTGRAEGMRLESAVKDGTLRTVIYSAAGQGIAAGSGPTVMVPVSVLSGSEAAPGLTLSQVILVDRQAQVIPVTLGTGTVKVEAPPAAFALKFNRPNPFNPSTTIGYEVAQATRVTLAVYNLLGQEVVRLVDAFRTPGRYEATWDGRNARGQAVSSGVYIYRMTTNTGFVETKRLTLLK